MTRAAWLELGITVLVWCALLGTAIGAVVAKHQARRLFSELRALENTRDELQVEWGQLQIEQSAWATHGRIENLARERLSMTRPDEDSILVVVR